MRLAADHRIRCRCGQLQHHGWGKLSFLYSPNRRHSWRPYSLRVCLSLVITLVIAACNSTPDPNAETARDPATLTAPEAFQDVQTPITLDNVSSLAYLGRLTQPEA